MARRVRPGEKLNITAAEYNRLLAAADAIARDRLSGGGGNRTHVRDAATVRVHYQSATTVPIGGIVGFNAPLGDPDVDNTALARFVRDARSSRCVQSPTNTQVDSVWPSSRSPRTRSAAWYSPASSLPV